VTIISNPKNPQPENGIPIRLAFTEQLTIGVDEGNEEYMSGILVRYPKYKPAYQKFVRMENGGLFRFVKRYRYGVQETRNR
jgi:hypothetical protein